MNAHRMSFVQVKPAPPPGGKDPAKLPRHCPAGLRPAGVLSDGRAARRVVPPTRAAAARLASAGSR